MQEMLLRPKYNYCFDTSALIDLNEDYPIDIFKPIWMKLENLIRNGAAHSPREVFKEIGFEDDDLLKWAKKNRSMFRNLDDQQVEKIKEVLKIFPNLVDSKKEFAHADPFIIAHALCNGCTVVTSEKPSPPGARVIQIPNVCDFYKIKCISLLKFFRDNGLRLKIA